MAYHKPQIQKSRLQLSSELGMKKCSETLVRRVKVKQQVRTVVFRNQTHLVNWPLL